MNEIKCEFCGTTFKNNKILLTHMRTAKYCLKIRGGQTPNDFVCDHCQKIFTHKIKLDQHILKSKCSIASECEKLRGQILKLETEKASLEEKLLFSEANINEAKVTISETKANINEAKANITKLQKKVKTQNLVNQKLKTKNKSLKLQNIELKDQLTYEKGVMVGYEKPKPPTSIVNAGTIINKKLQKIKCDTIRPLTSEYIQEASAEYTYELFLRGVSGVVEFITKMIKKTNIDGIVEQNYVCTDVARNACYKLVQSRVWEIDAGFNVINEIFDGLRQLQHNHWAELSERAAYCIDDRQKQYSQDKIIDLADFHRGIIDIKGTPERGVAFNKVRTHITQVAAI
jgi:hypothetical protein